MDDLIQLFVALAVYVLGVVIGRSEGRKASIWPDEREEVVKLLRDLCSQYGDNDWPDNLHLADVIERHLMDYLD